MFIQTEGTPNPNTIKFIPGKIVLGENKTANFFEKEAAVDSPLALALFAIDNVKSVFLGSDFISVTKQENSSWDLLKTEVLTTIMEHYVMGREVLKDGTNADSLSSMEIIDEQDQEIVDQIKEIIENRVRPAVAQDGGDIIFRGFKEGVVLLELHGACSGCPSSTITLKNGIENMLKYYIPEVISVESVNA